jgi:serine/threonine-protein kinase RsbW
MTGRTVSKRKKSVKGERLFTMQCMSHPRELNRLEKFLKDVNRVAHLDDGTFYRLHVATSEAVNNAILHGNKSDRSKKVCIRCLVRKSSLTVCVKDEGTGFNADAVPNPLAEGNLMKESGRGIFLIREMVDRVRFRSTREGTTVEMTIDLRRLNL